MAQCEHSPTNQRLEGASKAKPKLYVPRAKIFMVTHQQPEADSRS